MAPSGVLLMLLQLCGLQLLLVSMPTKCPLAGHLVRNAFLHLKEMGDQFPLHCLSYNRNMSFPDALVPAAPSNHSQCRQATFVVHESLRESELVFIEHDLPAGVNWTSDKLDKFLQLQNRVVEEGHCASSADTSGVLSSYFRNVTAVVEQQDACGWEVLRRDLRWVLKSVLKHHRHCFQW